MRKPEIIDLSPEEVESLKERIQSNQLTESDRELYENLLDFNLWLQFELEESKLSIHRLQKLFGFTPLKKKKKKKNTEPSVEEDSNNQEVEFDGIGNSNQKTTKRKGHGKIGEEEYTGADTVQIFHQSLTHRDPCPNTLCTGRVYRIKTAGTAIRLSGNMIVSATRYVYEKYKCNLCDQTFPAKLPEGVKQGKSYDESALAMMAISKYFLATPFYRLEKAQKMMGIPLPDSTQSDKMEELVNCAYPAFMAVVHYAAQGEIIHNDDTKARILSLMKENEELSEKDRKGIFTTGIVSKVGKHSIYLYFTGRDHAGENLSKVLAFRQSDLGAIIQMADASSSSVSQVIETILCFCLAHGLRKFSDIDHKYPLQCEKVLKDLEQVYKNDAQTKKLRMSPEERLHYHQEQSAPLMKNLKTWMDQQIEEQLVEPESSLYKAIEYMRKRWTGFTQFLRVADAPLDNNICEAALKLMIRLRKNSMFFKSELGALVASILVSLIYTTAIAGENPKDYLVALQIHRKDVFQNPELWLPFNYRKRVEEILQQTGEKQAA